MSTPLLELYLVDEHGVRWRVHDCVYGVPPSRPGKRLKLPLGDPRATERIFVAEDGTRRVVQLPKVGRGAGETTTWPLAPALATALAEQLRRAGYLGREEFDPATPGRAP